MDDLISRQAAIDRIDAIVPRKTDSDYQKGIAVGMAMAKVAIIEQKSAQPELIRCKDCKHRPTGIDRHDLIFPDEVCPCGCDDYWYSWAPEDDFFCGRAERRGRENDER